MLTSYSDPRKTNIQHGFTTCMPVWKTILSDVFSHNVLSFKS